MKGPEVRSQTPVTNGPLVHRALCEVTMSYIVTDRLFWPAKKQNLKGRRLHSNEEIEMVVRKLLRILRPRFSLRRNV